MAYRDLSISIGDKVMTESIKKPSPSPRRGLLISSTTATLFAIAGHLWLGFEQAVTQTLAALVTGYLAAILFEWIDAKFLGRAPRFVGAGPKGLFAFLLSAHMTSITTSFLLYTGSGHLVLCFAVVAAIGSKYLFRIQSNGRLQHFLNPSNFGIALTLLIFPWSTVIPYQYTEGLSGMSRPGNWILPLAILILGGRLNAIYTRRIPLILTWLVTFFVQGVIRNTVTGAPLFSGVQAATGVAFVLFTLYMITDPMTSPNGLRGQVLFGASVGLTYAALMQFHAIYTLFYAVTIVCFVRGLAHTFGLVPQWAISGATERSAFVQPSMGSQAVSK